MNISYIFNNIPSIILIVVYFVRIEIKIAKISQDISWIKRNINKCQLD